MDRNKNDKYCRIKKENKENNARKIITNSCHQQMTKKKQLNENRRVCKG